VSETLDATNRWPTRAALEAARPTELRAERRFRVGVGAVTAAAAAFFALRLMAWPPHEDETLALFVGRHPLAEALDVVLDQRGGAPLHFLVAWLVVHAGGGLELLRGVSAVSAVASLPLVALLGRRVATTRVALLATALVATSWMFLFHGIYARMYGVFLLLALVSLHALLAAVERGGPLRWALWVASVLALIAAHPYGALVFGGEAVYAVLVRRRLLGGLLAGAAVLALGTPFWLTSLTLARRFDVGVGGGGAKLGGPVSVANYLAETLGDFTAGWPPALAAALVALGAGWRALRAERRQAAPLFACLAGVPTLAFLLARLGGNTAPEPRHLIFVLPLAALLVAAALLRLRERRPVVGALAIAATLLLQLAWGWHRTPALFEGEPERRVAARAAAADWLAATSRPDDVLLGYDPLFLAAFERNARFPLRVVPRADVALALRTVRSAPSLGRGVFVLDASDTSNRERSLTIRYVRPFPADEWEARRFGPFLVLRTREPVRTPAGFFRHAKQAMLVGKGLGLGDADVNYRTVIQAGRREGVYTPRSRSISSR
jgi:hypothetical protein